MAQGTLQKRRQKHCKSQRLREFAVRLYCSEQLIKKRGHVFEREQGEYMGDLGGRKWKGEMMWLYCNLKSKGKIYTRNCPEKEMDEVETIKHTGLTNKKKTIQYLC